MENEQVERLSLEVLTQLVLDLYYQDFTGRDAFFGEEHVGLMAGMAYARILNEEYRVNKLLNKSQTGFSWVELSPDWLRTETIKFSKSTDGEITAKLEKPLFFFDFDAMSSAVQSLRSVGGGCDADLVRISVNDVWKYKRMPFTNKVFYYVSDAQQITLLSRGCFPKEAKARYVASLFPITDVTGIPLTRGEDVAKSVLQLLLTAKNGTVVDKTNNSNPNALPQTEIDADSLRKS